MITDYSIEYCHIYSNQSVGQEHAESLDYLAEMLARLKQTGKTYSLCVMLDNYTFPDRIFDKDKFLNFLKQKEATPDIFINEGDLIEAADEVVSLVSPKRANSLKKYIQEKKYPCSLFIATWYLARGGYLKNAPAEIKKHSARLINILHERFKPFEEEGLAIIGDTPHSSFIKGITNVYFGGEAYPSIETRSLDLLKF